MRYLGVGVIVLLLMATGFFIGATSPAVALPAVQGVIGAWNGFYQSAVNMDDRAPMQVVITEQHHRRFMGTATIAAGEFPFRGTIAASGKFSIVGGSGRAKLEAEGMAQFFGDGSAFVQMRYRFKPPSPNRGGDNGLIILVRDIGLPGAPAVTGEWDGTYQSTVNPTDTGSLTADVTEQKGSTFRGKMMVNGLVFPFVGTIGPLPDPTAVEFHMIGLGAAGWFLVSGEYEPPDPATGLPPKAMAQYQLFFADGTRDAGTFDLSLR